MVMAIMRSCLSDTDGAALEGQITFLQPGFGSSNFGVCITELVDGLVIVLHAEEYQRPDFNAMVQTIVRLLDEYDIRFDNRCRIFVDGANPSFIRASRIG